jgi:hypothetical protein
MLPGEATPTIGSDVNHQSKNDENTPKNITKGFVGKYKNKILNNVSETINHDNFGRRDFNMM